MSGWVRRGAVLVHDGPFSEPTDAELRPYREPGTGVLRQVIAECGTPSGYLRHARHGEDTCAHCRAAWAGQARRRRREAS